MAVLIISRQFGAGGKTLGQRLAKRLGYTYVDRDIIDWVAEEADNSVEWVDEIEQGQPARLLQVLSKMVIDNFIERRMAYPEPKSYPDQYVTFVKKVITDTAAAGDVVILGRGAEFIIQDGPGNYKVLLVAHRADRVKFLQDKYHITQGQAGELIAKEEKERASFLAKLDPRDPNDPGLYQLCLHTSFVSMEKAERMILDLMDELDTGFVAV